MALLEGAFSQLHFGLDISVYFCDPKIPWQCGQ